MTDEVLVKKADGTRSSERRDRESNVYIVEVDPTLMLQQLHKEAKESPEYDIEDRCDGFKIIGTRLGYVPTSEGLFVLNEEGCGLEVEDPITDEESIPIPLYKTFDDDAISIFSWASIPLTKEELLDMPVKGVVNFGEWVRKFGSRLETNFHNWNKHLTPIFDAEYIEKLESESD